MMYDREDDLPLDYPLHKVVGVMASAGLRERLHESAERRNFLNQIGHGAIQRSLSSTGRMHDGEYGGLGAMIYEIATIPMFTGVDASAEPSYHDPVGMHVAMKTALHHLEEYDSYDMLGHSYAAVSVLDEEAPVLSSLVTLATGDILGSNMTNDELRSVKVGAGIMRSLHIAAQIRLLDSNTTDLA